VLGFAVAEGEGTVLVEGAQAAAVTKMSKASRDNISFLSNFFIYTSFPFFSSGENSKVRQSLRFGLYPQLELERQKKIEHKKDSGKFHCR
jgi:hypothetical protein